MVYNVFSWNRLDVSIKSIFLNLKNKHTTFGSKIYKEHLRVWNNFKEYNNPNKNTYEAFESDFVEIYNDMKSNKFDWIKSPVVIDNEGYLLNGAHRSAAAAKLNIDIKTTIGEDIKDGQKICDYRLFKSLNLDEKYMDAAALEMIRKNKDLLVVNIFPSAVGGREEVDNILNDSCNIAYKKHIKLNNTGALNYMFQLYKGEEWAGSPNNNYAGFREKANLCFTNETPLEIYIVELKKDTDVIAMKNKIRAVYNIGNHSVHINDTHEETLRLSRCLLNTNSVHFLNNSAIVNYEKFNEYLKFYEQFIIDNELNIEDYCITASGVLALYGLRQAADLDYIHSDPEIIEDPEGNVNSHNEYGISLYPKAYDDIIYDPSNHFYFGNIKVAALAIVKDLKAKRNEFKDRIDIHLIESIT